MRCRIVGHTFNNNEDVLMVFTQELTFFVKSTMELCKILELYSNSVVTPDEMSTAFRKVDRLIYH